MPKIAYKDRSFRGESLATIAMAQKIIDEYRAQGFSLTLRQLYYQFVARGLIPNTLRSYGKLGNTINKARLAGLIDWLSIEDRTRWLREKPHWESPSDILDACAKQYAVDMWANQQIRAEVWIEKDALIGVIEPVCTQYDVPYFACRGYVSQSEQWRAAQRFIKYNNEGQGVIILHFGDHDPSGLDMTRDNSTRLDLFTNLDTVRVVRLALNMDQINTYNPPPNPAKVTDSRAKEYIREFGSNSWELDALEPKVIRDLIETNIKKLINTTAWQKSRQAQDEGRELLRNLAQQQKGGS